MSEIHVAYYRSPDGEQAGVIRYAVRGAIVVPPGPEPASNP